MPACVMRTDAGARTRNLPFRRRLPCPLDYIGVVEPPHGLEPCPAAYETAVLPHVTTEAWLVVVWYLTSDSNREHRASEARPSANWGSQA